MFSSNYDSDLLLTLFVTIFNNKIHATLAGTEKRQYFKLFHIYKKHWRLPPDGRGGDSVSENQGLTDALD